VKGKARGSRLRVALPMQLHRLVLRFDPSRRDCRCLRRFALHLSHLHPAGSRKISK
jgi:hypothetical protein